MDPTSSRGCRRITILYGEHGDNEVVRLSNPSSSSLETGLWDRVRGYWWQKTSATFYFLPGTVVVRKTLIVRQAAGWACAIYAHRKEARARHITPWGCAGKKRIPTPSLATPPSPGFLLELHMSSARGTPILPHVWRGQRYSAARQKCAAAAHSRKAGCP